MYTGNQSFSSLFLLCGGIFCVQSLFVRPYLLQAIVEKWQTDTKQGEDFPKNLLYRVDRKQFFGLVPVVRGRL